MIFQEVVNQVVKDTNSHPIEVDAVLRTLFDVVKEHVAQGEAVQIYGFGRFEKVWRASKPNNISAHPPMIPARYVPKFYPSPVFKASVKESGTT